MYSGADMQVGNGKEKWRHRAQRALQERADLRRAAAWMVHILTASGALLGLLAMDAVARQSWREAVALMAVACFVDGIDGTVARWVGVKEAVPEFDGALLDNIVDYLNYALVPAYFFFHAELMPPAWKVAAAAVILFSSSYQFCQSDAKTEDHYFRGFPSLWNVAVVYLLISGLDPRVNLGIILFLGLLSFIPVKYIYPSRTVAFQKLTLVLTAIWTVMMFAIVCTLPHPPIWLVRASWFYVAYYALVSWYLTVRDALAAESELGRF